MLSGGDEFAVVVPGAGRAQATALAARMVDALAERAPASIGAAVPGPDGDSAEGLYRCADRALYEHKRARRPAVSAA
jgi:GGDEF domain-containing protein